MKQGTWMAWILGALAIALVWPGSVVAGRLPIQREAQVLTHIHPCTLWFTSAGAPLFTGPTCPATPGAAKCPEPLCMIEV